MSNTNTPKSMVSKIYSNVIKPGKTRHWSWTPSRGKRSKVIRSGEADFIRMVA